MAIRAPNGDTKTRSSRRLRQRGFTLLSTAINFTVAGVVLAGGWMAFGAMRTQWKVANADRMMDQYGTGVMQELTNMLSWGWGAQPVQAAGRSIRWRWVMDDFVDPLRGAGAWDYPLRPSNQDYSYLEYSYAPARGVLINGMQPDWVYDTQKSWYLWTGSRPGYLQTRSFDHRDRMTVEGLVIDFYNFPDFPTFGEGAAEDELTRQMVAKIELTVHYTYSASNNLFGLFADRYVRERKFETKVCMRNWWVENNSYRNVALGRYGYTSG